MQTEPQSNAHDPESGALDDQAPEPAVPALVGSDRRADRSLSAASGGEGRGEEARFAREQNVPAHRSAPAGSDCLASLSPIENQKSEIENSSEHRCRGKLARLPKPLRDLVNRLLDDGQPYRTIKQRLEASSDPPLPHAISEKDISRWYAKGYQRYLAHQDHLDFLRENRESALDMVANDDTATIPEATLQIIASQYFDLLGDFSPDSLKHKLTEDPLKYTRFLNVFARLVREIVHLKKYRELAAKNAPAALPAKDPAREPADNELGVIMDNLDRVFKMRRPRNPAPPLPQPPTPAPTSPPEHTPPATAPVP